jgi:hypothetical protein
MAIYELPDIQEDIYTAHLNYYYSTHQLRKIWTSLWTEYSVIFLEACHTQTACSANTQSMNENSVRRSIFAAFKGRL